MNVSNVDLINELKNAGKLWYFINPYETIFEFPHEVPDYHQQVWLPFFILIILEQIILIFKKKKKFRLNDQMTSLSHWLFQETGRIFFRGAEYYAYIIIYEKYRLWNLPWNSAWTWCLTAVGVDFCYYWVHRSNHEVHFLWAQHQVHHSSEEFNLAVGLRQSILQHWCNFMLYLPLALFIPPSHFIAHNQFNLIYQLWIHTTVIDDLGPLELIFNTPKHHRVHHGCNLYCLDKNYGGVLIVWDKLFGTFEKEKDEIIYGLVVSPQSFNPLYLQIFYTIELIKKSIKISSLTNKLAVVWKGPSWFPGAPRLGLDEYKVNVTSRIKYDKHIPIWQNLYIIIHFFLVLYNHFRIYDETQNLSLKVILDFVPNHSSHEHPWFKKSVQRIKPYDEYYVWRDARIVNGTRQPPNNWLSVFWGSAWEWNDVRQQYYLHQFAAGQPDLNYRSAALDQEMKNVLTFWMDRGVDGFRIDAINHMFEDKRLLDEPSANRTDLSKDDYESLVHVYTRDQNETYDVLRSWRNLMDEHSNRTNSDPRMILTEAYTEFNLTVKYYKSGSTVPFNFMFIMDLNNQSTASDFKQLIDRWVGNVPNGSVANWVSGNHDNHRVASRFGRQRADEILMLTLTLPGIGVVYNGDEIGMEDRPFTYAETVDPAGCNAGPAKYYLKSRDPERTPYQWDNSTSAGFSDRNKTWLPVNDNYRSLNLAAQKKEYYSHYVAFKSMSYLKKQPVIANGSLEVDVIDGKVLSVKRKLGNDTVIVMVNFSKNPVTINMSTLHPPADLVVYANNVIGSGLSHGNWIYPTSMTIPGSNSAIFTNYKLYWRYWQGVDWL